MKTYKNFYGSRDEYIAFCKNQVIFWAKAFYETTDEKLRTEWALELDAAEQALASEGIDWDEIEKLENEAYQTA